MPKRSSKRRHSSTVSGAELDVMKRSVGRLSRRAARLAVEQHVDGRRIAGRDGGAVIANVLEETAGGEFLRHHQRGAAVERHQRAEKLRRGPVEGTEIVDPVVRGDAEALGGGIDIGKVLAEIQHHALGPRARAGGEQDDGVVVRLPRRSARRSARSARPHRRTCRRRACPSVRAACAAPRRRRCRSSSCNPS